MGDHAALIAEVDAAAADWRRVYGKPNYPENLTLALRPCDALQAVQQTPAVDREALAAHFHRDAWTLSDEQWVEEYVADNREHYKRQSLARADAVIASGILLDAAEVEAGGARGAYREARRLLRGEFEPLVMREPDWRNVDAELLRAQQVREGN